MKKSVKISAVFFSLLTIFYILSGAAISADDDDEEFFITTTGRKRKPIIATVTALGDAISITGKLPWDRYYLSDGGAVSEKELKEYCSEKTELEYGDVVKIYCSSTRDSFPHQYNWSNCGGAARIEYLGKASDYYDTKELTVKEINNGVIFEDSEGKEYPWRFFHKNDFNPYGIYEYGYIIPEEFQQDNMKTGDKFLCSVTTVTCYEADNTSYEVDCVVVPVSKLESAPDDTGNEDYVTTPSGHKYKPRIVTVTAIKDDSTENGLMNQGKYYLSDDTAISEKELEKYCDEKTELEYGDTLKIYCILVNNVIPGQYNWGGGGEEPKIEYLGKASDYYETKELTVKEKDKNVIFEDSEGKEYPWKNYGNRCYNPYGMERCGYFIPEEFHSSSINTGDKFICALTTETCYDSAWSYEQDCVVVPVSKVGSAPAEPDITDNTYKNIPELVVLGTNGSGEDPLYYLSNNCLLSQKEFEKYSGKNFSLQYGDIIKVYNAGIDELFPGQFCWENGEMTSEIEYLGKASDYYSVKELTLIEKSNQNDSAVFEDIDGKGYLWKNIAYNARLWTDNFTVPSEFNLEFMETGTKYKCAVDSALSEEYVVIPVEVLRSSEPEITTTVPAPAVSETTTLSETAKPAVLKGDISGNGKIDIYDAIEIAKSLTGMKTFTDEEKSTADINGDGKVDLYDAIEIAKILIANK